MRRPTPPPPPPPPLLLPCASNHGSLQQQQQHAQRLLLRRRRLLLLTYGGYCCCSCGYRRSFSTSGSIRRRRTRSSGTSGQSSRVEEAAREQVMTGGEEVALPTTTTATPATAVTTAAWRGVVWNQRENSKDESSRDDAETNFHWKIDSFPGFSLYLLLLWRRLGSSWSGSSSSSGAGMFVDLLQTPQRPLRPTIERESERESPRRRQQPRLCELPLRVGKPAARRIDRRIDRDRANSRPRLDLLFHFSFFFYKKTSSRLWSRTEVLIITVGGGVVATGF